MRPPVSGAGRACCRKPIPATVWFSGAFWAKKTPAHAHSWQLQAPSACWRGHTCGLGCPPAPGCRRLSAVPFALGHHTTTGTDTQVPLCGTVSARSLWGLTSTLSSAESGRSGVPVLSEVEGSKHVSTGGTRGVLAAKPHPSILCPSAFRSYSGCWMWNVPRGEGI